MALLSSGTWPCSSRVVTGRSSNCGSLGECGRNSKMIKQPILRCCHELMILEPTTCSKLLVDLSSLSCPARLSVDVVHVHEGGPDVEFMAISSFCFEHSETGHSVVLRNLLAICQMS
jgi:hypothetical protein